MQVSNQKEINMTPLVSVIIPVYNDAARLKLCLQALQSQTYSGQDFEVIVVDNNSTEDISGLVFNTNLNLVFLKENKTGSYAARNTAIRQSKGEILAFTDSDCIPDGNWLFAGIECLKSDINVGVVAGAITLFYKSSKLSLAEVYEKHTAFHQKEGAQQGFNTTANWFSYKRTVLEAGCFEENLKSNGDSILSNKIYKMGYQIKYCPDAIVKHPARREFYELSKKRKRIIGGRYDLLKLNKKNLPFGLLKACFSFLRSNVKKSGAILKSNKTEGVRYLIVVVGLFFSIIFESMLLLLGKRSSR